MVQYRPVPSRVPRPLLLVELPEETVAQNFLPRPQPLRLDVVARPASSLPSSSSSSSSLTTLLLAVSLVSLHGLFGGVG